MTPAIELQDASVRLDGAAILTGVTLDVASGSIAVVLGPSGAGKSTFLRLLAGLVPGTGTLRLFGADAHGVAPHRRSVGLAFQDPRLLPHLTLAENIALPLWVGGVSPGHRARRVRELAERMEIEDLLDRRPEAVSGGQAHRASVARALVAEPRLLLIDEAFGTLDPPLRARLVADVARVARAAGTTIVLVTHDRELALSAADLLVVLVGGEVLQHGAPREVYAAPASLSVARLVGEMDTLADGPYLLGVRPADVRLAARDAEGREDPAPPPANGGDERTEARPGTVLGSRFLGSSFEHRVALEGGEVRAIDTSVRVAGSRCLARLQSVMVFDATTGRRCGAR